MKSNAAESPGWLKALTRFAVACQMAAFVLALMAIWATGSYWPARLGNTAALLAFAGWCSGLAALLSGADP